MNRGARPCPLLLAIPGAEKAARRFAKKFGRKGDQVFEAIVQRRGGVMTSSCGRLFDGVAALLGLGDFNSYEGELPSRLQAEAEKARPQKKPYPYAIEQKGGMSVLNMLLAVEAMLADKRSRAEKARCFHLTLANGLLDMAIHCTGASGIRTVALSGGVFQNLLLLKMSRNLLQKNGFQVLHHVQVPPNDGGLSLGTGSPGGHEIWQGVLTMCLAVPMKVIEINNDMAVVESAGLRREVGIMLLDKVKLNDWVLIHAGFAISKLTKKQARETLAIFEEGRFFG